MVLNGKIFTGCIATRWWSIAIYRFDQLSDIFLPEQRFDLEKMPAHDAKVHRIRKDQSIEYNFLAVSLVYEIFFLVIQDAVLTCQYTT